MRRGGVRFLSSVVVICEGFVDFFVSGNFYKLVVSM